MDKLLEQGIISSLFSGVDPHARPLLEATTLILVAGGAITGAVNPILEFISRIWNFFVWLGDSIRTNFRKLFGPKETASSPVESQEREIPEELTIWEQHTSNPQSFPKKNGIPIIAIANMKGGVGKTTIAANLAMYFRDELKKPVLLIDFDYQGSLSQTIRGEAGHEEPDITADILISEPARFPDPLVYAREMRRKVENVFIYPTSYQFATIENNLMANWLSGNADDLVYRLCNVLKRDDVQQKFGAVLIDCPPRLTTGAINALCASTHLLVPTTLDDMSAQAAEYFLTQVERMRGKLFPSLQVIGIVPSIVYQDGSKLLGEMRNRENLTIFGKTHWNRDDFVLSAAPIPRSAEISNVAGVGVAWTRKQSVRQHFQQLGNEVQKRMK